MDPDKQTPLNEADRDWVVKYFERIIHDQDRRINQALDSSTLAVGKAEQAQERRLDLLNEFRAQSKDEQAKFALRENTEPRLVNVETSIARLYGGLFAVSLIGIANLVKLFLS